VRNTPTYTDPAAIEASAASWNRHMHILEAQLQRTGAFVSGAQFTLADIALGLSTHRWFMTPIERPRLGAVQAFYERLSMRPAFLKHGRNGVP
jgi:glutathione S-transferase